MESEDRIALRKRFGARLKALRHERGWTGDQVSERVGCSRGYYYKLERGVGEFSVEMLARLAGAFRLDEVDFFMFPETSPLRHGIYDLLRRAPEPVLLRLKLSLLEELGQSTPGEDASEPAKRRTGEAG